MSDRGIDIEEITAHTVVELTEDLLAKIEKKYDFFTPGQEEMILSFYEKFEDELSEFASKGFAKAFTNFKQVELFKLTMKLVGKVEKFTKKKRGMDGQDKKDLIINTLIVLIERELDVNDKIKKYLVEILKVIVPILIDEIIDITKKVHTKKKRGLCCF